MGGSLVDADNDPMKKESGPELIDTMLICYIASVQEELPITLYQIQKCVFSIKQPDRILINCSMAIMGLFPYLNLYDSAPIKNELFYTRVRGRTKHWWFLTCLTCRRYLKRQLFIRN